MVLRVSFVLFVVALAALPSVAQKKAKSSFVQTFAIPSKGLIRKSEKDDLLRQMNHPDAKPAKKVKKAKKK